MASNTSSKKKTAKKSSKKTENSTAVCKDGVCDVPKNLRRSAQEAKGDDKWFAFNIDADADGLKVSMRNHLKYTFAKDANNANLRDWWLALCHGIRDRILERYIRTQTMHHRYDAKRVYYLSLEYLMGRLLTNNVYNAGLMEDVNEAVREFGLDYADIEREEDDMGLGNGGLGRLAACFLDSLATLDYPAIGYGIHYEFGLFKQYFQNGHQIEVPDNWLHFGNPWQVVRPEARQEIPLYGKVVDHYDDKGDWHPKWVDTKTVVGVPWDIPIVGYGAGTVNFLRLWEARASEEFDLTVFNEGGYVDAVHEKVVGETISKVLYPNDKTESGKELRLMQQYFFVACSLKDIIRRYEDRNVGWTAFPEKAAIQLNDTHPAVAVAELMRVLIDEKGLDWDKAWDVCHKVFGYTNHTLLPEALEKWSVSLFEKILPRHLQIIYEINRRFLEEVEKKWPGDDQKKIDMSIIIEGEHRMIRMAYLATVASHSVNGVAALHTELLKQSLFKDFYELYPERFNNKTNGVTPRRWIKACNPELSSLIDSKIPHDWILHLDKVQGLAKYADDKKFQKEFMAVKHRNKEKLALYIACTCDGLEVDPHSMFDVQIKRLHEYKRQHLNLLHILTLYHRLLHNPDYDIHPRTFIFGAKAAPGYELAKEIIYAINKVGEAINNDSRIKGKLKIAFIPNYRVSAAMRIIPAADLSEQISTAGKEASGTGNMKLAMNGALTIGTLDGANVEMKEEVGDENIFIFGMTVEEVEELRARGYNPWDYYHSNEELKAILDWLCSDFFTPGEHNSFAKLRHSLLDGGDPFMVLADYEAYCKAQEQVDAAYKDKERWAKMAIMNTAKMGKFSSDRTINEYAEEIWGLDPMPVTI